MIIGELKLIWGLNFVLSLQQHSILNAAYDMSTVVVSRTWLP